MLTTGQQLGCMCVQPGTARRVTGAERGQTSNGEADEVQTLFKKFSAGDDQMDADEFTAALKEIFNKGP